MRWNRKGYEVEAVDYDADLKAFEVSQGDTVQTIYPADLDEMESIVKDLDEGICVSGWEDGLGNTIVIN